MISFVPHTEKDLSQMLDLLKVSSIDQLFSEIVPSSFWADFSQKWQEEDIISIRKRFSQENQKPLPDTSLVGGGYYSHFIPPIVKEVARRPELYTAYTPYQPEATQGILQLLYEYQSIMSRLYGMEISNASLYDGATSLAEAILMATRVTNRNKVIIDSLVNPLFLSVLRTYILPRGINLSVLERDRMFDSIDESVAGVVIQMPDFWGQVFDIEDIEKKIHSRGGLLISSNYPISLGMLKPPGQLGVDIATGEGQSLGLNLNFGGPYLGIFTTRMKYVRSLPGRIVGKTKDKNGKDCFVLTFQTREQHIRRERATSNICSNQSLCAILSLVYLLSLGFGGLKDISYICHNKASEFRKRLRNLGCNIVSSDNFFNEFVIKLNDVDKFYNLMLGEGIVPGIRLGRFNKNWKDLLLVCVTEKTDDLTVEIFEERLKCFVG